jgi:hypothetical protein
VPVPGSSNVAGMSSNSGSGAAEGHGPVTEEEITRTFGWRDMFVRPEDDPRSDGGFLDERGVLLNYLPDCRLTLDGRVGQ